MVTNAPDDRNTTSSAPSGRGSARLRALDRTAGLVALRALGAVRRARRLGADLERIGLMKTAGIGDMTLLAAVAEDALAAFPETEFVIVAGPENAPLAEMIPRSRVLTLPTVEPWKVVPLLRAQRFDALVDFGQWTRVEAVYTGLSRARWTAGFETPGQNRHDAYDATAHHRGDVPEIENYRALIRLLGVDSTTEPHLEPLPAMPEVTTEPYVVLHMWPGGFRSELREWPAERWRELIAALTAEGLTVLLTGGPTDVQRADAFLASCGPPSEQVISIVGRCRLPELVGVLGGARCVVSVNTGVMHMAAAVGARTIALNGPTSSLRWGPIGPDVTNLHSELPGCGYLNLGFEYDGQRIDCMEGISVERVLAATRDRVGA
jgi:ADP-heptose:LPS heptosyltransferase